MRKLFMRWLLGSMVLVGGMLVGQTPGRAAPISYLGDLTDGAVHIGSSTGFWTVSVNAGDVVTVTARRLSAFDPVAGAWNGLESDTTAYSSVSANSTNTLSVGAGDDQLAANCCGGGFGDPQFSFAALTSGTYTVAVFQFNNTIIQNLGYSVSAVGATRSIPEPGTLILLGAGLLDLSFARHRKAA